MATLAQRAKAIIDALADANVPNETATKWVTLIYNHSPLTDENGDIITEPTNNQLGRVLIQTVRQHLRNIATTQRAPDAAETARAAEIAAVQSEVDSELGSD